MSGKKYTLWCLVDGEEISFSVDASPTLTIDQLKATINETIKTNLKAYKLVLWKPKEEIPVKPSDTLAQRLNELGLGLSQMAEKLDPIDKVEDSFQTLTPTSFHLNILVQLPPPIPRDESPHKRLRLADDPTSSQASLHTLALAKLQQFWESLWQDHKDPFLEISVQRDPNPVQSVDVPATMNVLHLPTVISGIGDVMIRGEYDEAMKYIENLRTSERQNRGVVIAGHPGIGKTILLYYILVKRLLDKKPTVFQNHSDYVLLFNNDGFQVEQASLFMDPGQSAHQDTWALVDMSPWVEELAVFIQSSPFFTVIASSPKASRWDNIMRYRGPVAFWFMKPFSLAELIQARQLQPFGHTEADIENFFEMYGPSARDCYTFCHDDTLGKYNSAVRRKIKQMSWNSLTEILTWQTEGMEMDKGSHMVVLVGPQPNNRAAPRTGIVTDIDFTSGTKRREFLSFCGRGLFEPAFHELCVGGVTFTIYRITAKCQRVNYEFTADHLNDCESETLTLSPQTRRFFNRKHPIDSLLPDYYYQPTAPNQSSCDSFIYDPNSHQFSAFQVTVGQKHTLASKGVTKLRELGQRLEIGDLKIRIIVVVFENAQMTFTIDKGLFDSGGLEVYVVQVTEDQLYHIT